MAEYSEENEVSTKSFNLVSWSQEGLRWLKQEVRKNPIEEWSDERRELIKKDLEPIVEIYQKL